MFKNERRKRERPWEGSGSLRGLKMRDSVVMDKATIEATMAEAEDGKEWSEKAIDVMEECRQC